MPRIAPSQSIAFDILDWIFFNQLLASDILHDEEKAWLRDLVDELREVVSQTGATGIEAERLKHAVLCLLEVRLSEIQQKTNHDHSIALPPDLTPKTVQDVIGHTSNVFQAMVLALCEKTDGIAFETVAGIFNRLMGKFSPSDPMAGHRLAERALFLEYPCAALDFFLWMAGNGIISSKKCDAEKASSMAYEMPVARIGMLCELETIRNWMMNATCCTIKDETVLRQSEELSEKAVNALLERLSYYKKLTHAKSVSLLAYLRSNFESPEKATTFLVNFGKTWKRSRIIDRTQAGWIGMLGAGMIQTCREEMPEKPLYVENNNHGTITDVISKKLRAAGCTVSGRTVYESHQYLASRIRPRLEHYQRTRRVLARVLPSAYPDITYDMTVVAAMA
jgi:hypothetical protein